MLKSTINMDEWLAELQTSTQGVAVEGFSTVELVRHLGCGRSRAVSLIRQAISDGKACLAGRRKQVAIDGTIHWIPVYRPTAKLTKKTS
mgnify:CR=1 FL=1